MRFIFVLAIVGMVSSGELNAQSYTVKWKDLVGVSDNNGVLTKTSPGVAWNAGANAYNVLPAGVDGWVEFTVADLNSLSIIGFSILDADLNYPSTLYSWYVGYNTGYFMESGGYNQLKICAVGDVLRVSREGNFVKYYRNGILQRSAAASAGQPWRVKGLLGTGSNPVVRSSFDVQLTLTKTVTPVQSNGTGGAIQVVASGGTAPYSYRWSSGETAANISNKNLGDYSVMVKDAAGRTFTETYHLGYPTQILYVKKGATGAGDGSTWVNAYADLQQALTAAAGISGHKEIWVSRGEYRPANTVDRNASFNLPANTFLYGGFVGGESALEKRNWRQNRTVLSGDLGVLFDKNDNSYHVVVAMNVDGNSGIDGFVITQGNANSSTTPESYYNSGGGMVVVGTLNTTSPKINNCEFIDNTSSAFGGGLANVADGGTVAPVVTNCFFNGNSGLMGGGVGNFKNAGSISPVFTNCSFSTNHSTLGGAMANQGGSTSVFNCTITKNICSVDGGAIHNNDGSSMVVKNSILWENFKGTSEASGSYNQIANFNSTPIIQNNIIQGGYGTAADKNTNEDPLFVREPSVVGKYPRTNVIPIANTDSKYENMLNFSGPKLSRSWVYWTYYDLPFQKLYVCGMGLQVIDFANRTNGLPTSTVYGELGWARIQRPEKSIYTAGNKIYIGTGRQGLFSVDRASGVATFTDVLADEPVTKTVVKVQDIVIDNNNNLLYAPVFYTEDSLYGLLELNLTTNAKRWITTTSSPVALAAVNPVGNDDYYWNGHRLFHDEVANILYYSMGNGVWWWNRNTNATGVINTEGGIPLLANNPKLPSNKVTSMFIDREENKFYFGTHAGLFVWNRNNNTSKIYNTQNSLLGSNLINTIDKNSDANLIFVGCELNGGLFTFNSVTGEQKLFMKDVGDGNYPAMIDNEIESAFYYEHDKKLYVCSDGPNGGVLVKDYGNLVPDYGDLSLQNGSPAIDKSDSTAYSVSVMFDINGMDRFVNYAAMGANSLDLGAYEKALICQQLTSDFQIDRIATTYVFTPVLSQESEGCAVSYSWNFGDGGTSTESNPSHAYAAIGSYPVALTIQYTCGECASSTISMEHSLTKESLCESVYCNDDGSVSIGTPDHASGYRLSVYGKIITEGAKVALSSRWPDYVFQSGYQLQPLPELKQFIKVNGHLPGVPSSATVKKDGIDAAGMSTILLQKTEELTLYLIQLDERLRKLESKDSAGQK